MPLPQPSGVLHTCKLKTTKETITYRELVTNDKLALLKAIEENDTVVAEKTMANMIASVIISPSKYSDYDEINQLNVVDFAWLYTSIMAASSKSIIPLSITCAKCGDVVESRIRLTDAVFKEGVNSIVIGLASMPTVKIELTLPIMRDLENISDDLTQMEKAFYGAASHLNSTIEGETVTNRDEFTLESAANFMGQLVDDDLVAINEAVEQLPELTSSATFTCKCGHTETHTYNSLMEFFT